MPFDQLKTGNLAGNLVDMEGVARTYNAANQLVDDGANTLTYDDNGNLTSDGVNAYTWDRANRLLSMGGVSYAYDGLNNRVEQTVGANVTQYLLDVQPELVKVLAATTGANTDRYIYSPRGIHAQEDNAGVWTWAVQDALGSVRSEADNNVAVQATRNFAPYLTEFGTQGTFALPFAATGEQIDPNQLLFLRNRYLNPALGVFASLDPVEGMTEHPMSLNGYNYVESNPVNLTDPSGMLFWFFQANAPRSQLYNPAYYLTSAVTRAYAHAWIERWLEAFNGGFWQTHVEFPGARRGQGEKRVDAIVFDRTAIGGQSPIDFSNFSPNSVQGSVYEIEPLTPATKPIEGLAELSARVDSLRHGNPHPSLQRRLVGTLRTRESWNPRRSLGQYAGAAYNLLPVQWSAGASLLLAAPARGVFEVDPKQLESRAVGIPETYFIFMPVDGLIVYETRSRIAAALAIALGSITLDIAGKYLADKYDRIPGAPRRKPGFAFMETPRSTPNVPEFELCQQLNGGICRIDPVNLFEPFPELFRPEGEPHLLPPLDFFGDDDFDVFPFDILMNEGM